MLGMGWDSSNYDSYSSSGEWLPWVEAKNKRKPGMLMSKTIPFHHFAVQDALCHTSATPGIVVCWLLNVPATG